MPGVFDFSDMQNEGSNFGWGDEPPRPAAPTVQPPQAMQQPTPVQIDEWGQPVIRQRPPAEIGPEGVPQESNQEPGGRPICPADGTKMHKAGFRWSGRTHKLQAYQCPTCGYTTTKKLPVQASDYAYSQTPY